MIQTSGAQMASPECIAFTLGHRLPLLNVQLRKHWSSRGRTCRALAQEVHVLIGWKQKPPSPWGTVRIRVERHSPREPDEEGLTSCVKHLLDVLQPMHPKIRPYGLGIIENDHRKCVVKLDVIHVPSAAAITNVLIERVVAAVSTTP